jgi:hypothetical protein
VCMAKHVRSREGSPRHGRIRRWLVKMGLVFDPSVPGNPRLDADNSIHEGRARASGFSDV